LSSGCDRVNPFEYAAYKRALASNTKPALTDFVTAYPRSRHRQEIAGVLAQMEARIRRLHSDSFDRLSHQKFAEAVFSEHSSRWRDSPEPGAAGARKH
jgi:hypothetical protein